jgi:hypothetical protein
MQRNGLASLDTNCLLRWILGDVPEQTALMNELIASGKNFAAADAVLKGLHSSIPIPVKAVPPL